MFCVAFSHAFYVAKRVIFYYQSTPEKHRGFIDSTEWPTQLKLFADKTL